MKNMKKLSFVIFMAVVFLGGSVAVFFQQMNTVPPPPPIPLPSAPVAEVSPPQVVVEPPPIELNLTPQQIEQANQELIQGVEKNEFYKGLTKKYKSAKNKMDAKALFKKSVIISSTPLHPEATKEDMISYRQNLIVLMDCAKKLFDNDVNFI